MIVLVRTCSFSVKSFSYQPSGTSEANTEDQKFLEEHAPRPLGEVYATHYVIMLYERY